VTATLLPTARRFLLAFACLALPFSASAQGVPVVTENQLLQKEQGDTASVSVRVEDLGEEAQINAVDVELDYGDAPVRFVEFILDGTLLESWFTDQSDEELADRAALSAASNDALGGGTGGGVLVDVVFEVTGEEQGTVTFPEVEFNDKNSPSADLSRADLQIAVGRAVTIGEARDAGPGTAVSVEGTVTRALGAHVRLQDESGPTGASGLTVRQASGSLSEGVQDDIEGGTISQGTELAVEGTLSERNGLLLIGGEDLLSYSVAGQGSPPFPQPVSLFELEAPGGADYESELLRVEDVSFETPSATDGTLDANTTYTVVSEDGTAVDYRVGGAEETAVIGASIPRGSFTYEGVLGRSEGGFALVPVRRSTGLPVELARLEATLSGGAATLTWGTASETDNAGFEVQHWPPGAEAWESLGFVESSAEGGTTSAPQSYRFETGPLPPGEHRFRLRQVDLGGGGALSGAVRLKVRAERALTLEVAGPNPARQSTRIAFTTRQDGKARVALHNTLGQQVRRLSARQAQAGTRHEVTLSAKGLPSGTYFARLVGPTGTRAEKIVVLR
jgi:hypothetical protein